jgi:hypothetical protein
MLSYDSRRGLQPQFLIADHGVGDEHELVEAVDESLAVQAVDGVGDVPTSRASSSIDQSPGDSEVSSRPRMRLSV